MIGFSRLFAYPNHKNTLDNVPSASMVLSLKNGRTSANTKNGNQQIVNALIIMPSVVLAFLSFASWKRSFFWLLFAPGDVRIDVNRLDFCCFCLFGCFVCWDLPVSIGHWDSLLRRVAKHRPKLVFSKLHCNKKNLLSYRRFRKIFFNYL